MTSIANGAVIIQTSSEAVPSTPSWFGEVTLLARYLRKHEVLTKINERVHFVRRRFGHYEVIDFLAVLFGYAGRASLYWPHRFALLLSVLPLSWGEMSEAVIGRKGATPHASSCCCARGVGRPSRLFLLLAPRYSTSPSSPCEVAQRAIVSRSFWSSIRGTP
jgi:hypothetical protein